MKSELPSGTLVQNRYLIERLLGSGGFGRTYLASDQQRFEEKCVLKEFIPDRTGDIQKAQELFEREAKTLYQLNHPQIPKFIVWFEDDERLFLVQDYVNGKTYWTLLQERLEQGRTFSEQEIIQWLQEFLPVLEYVHSKGIIHRDIAPDNIMLSSASSKPMLIDFGAVKQEMTNLLPTGRRTFIGKQGYSAPEQLQAGNCSPSSDLYALAVTVIVLLTGKIPQDLLDEYSLEWKWRNYTQVSESLANILDKMLKGKPNERYQSATQVINALQSDNLEVQNPPETERQESSPESIPTHIELTPSTNLQQSISSQTDLMSSTSSQQSQTSSQETSPPPVTSKPLPWPIFAAVGVIFLAGVGLGSTYIDPICQMVGNCYSYTKLLQESEAIAADATRLTNNAISFENLIAAKQKWQQAKEKLQAIPNNAQVYAQANSRIGEYDKKREEVELQIDNLPDCNIAVSNFCRPHEYPRNK